MSDFKILEDDDGSINFNFDDNICRSRSMAMKRKQISIDESTTSEPISKRKKIRQYITYFIVTMMIAAGILVPIIVALLRKSVVYVPNRVTSQPVTMSMITKTTTTGITTTTTPFDQCNRRFVALTKKMSGYISSVAAADLNKDNKIDIIFIDESNSDVFILFNLGNDKFADPVSYPSTGQADSIIIVDIDNDGNLDIITGVTCWDGICVNILLNIGNGTFNNTHYLNSFTYGSVSSVAVADINNDNKYDIIIADSKSNNIVIHPSTDNNIFGDVIIYPVGTFPMSLTVIDLNGDNKSDIIVANTKSDNIGILFNKGNGIFSDQITHSVGSRPSFVITANINNDNIPDIIVVNFFSNRIDILFNNGSGSFTRKTSILNMANPLSVALTDFNSDGKIDIIVPNYHSNNVDVFFNNGYGTFNTSVNYITYPLPRTVAATDLNNDKKSDIIVGNGFYIGAILTTCY